MLNRKVNFFCTPRLIHKTVILHPIEMYKIKFSIILLTLLCLTSNELYAKTSVLDVLSYHLTIEPEIQKGTIKGTVIIKFKKITTEKSIVLNLGNLKVDQVDGKHVKSFRKNEAELIIELSEQEPQEYQISISYHGTPGKGLLFNPGLGQAHTVYFTSEWMVCNDDPDDRATLSIDILVPKGKQCIASGELTRTEDKGDKTLFQWKQNYATPAYTYGFAIGSFTKVAEQIGEVRLDYYSSQLNEKELKKVFRETGNILQFFELKSGVKYVQKSYSQIIIGSNYQEMSGLSVLSDSYPSSVLKDSSEIHLTSHELAHQWWGNMITCKNLNHFWLNEAFAVYMASAFNEYKFGKKKYLSDIALYKGIYEDLVKRDKDKPLVFPNWKPSRDNRHVIYYKGAYVLHLLREELGDETFWKGIKAYSKRYFGKSVKTENFKQAMEKATNTDLGDFFNEWVYKKR